MLLQELLLIEKLGVLGTLGATPLINAYIKSQNYTQNNDFKSDYSKGYDKRETTVTLKPRERRQSAFDQVPFSSDSTIIDAGQIKNVAKLRAAYRDSGKKVTGFVAYVDGEAKMFGISSYSGISSPDAYLSGAEDDDGVIKNISNSGFKYRMTEFFEKHKDKKITFKLISPGGRIKKAHDRKIVNDALSKAEVFSGLKALQTRLEHFKLNNKPTAKDVKQFVKMMIDDKIQTIRFAGRSFSIVDGSGGMNPTAFQGKPFSLSFKPEIVGDEYTKHNQNELKHLLTIVMALRGGSFVVLGGKWYDEKSKRQEVVFDEDGYLAYTHMVPSLDEDDLIKAFSSQYRNLFDEGLLSIQKRRSYPRILALQLDKIRAALKMDKSALYSAFANITSLLKAGIEGVPDALFKEVSMKAILSSMKENEFAAPSMLKTVRSLGVDWPELDVIQKSIEKGKQ